MAIGPRKFAFPTPNKETIPGMLLRDYFAAQALSGLLANPNNQIQQLEHINSLAELSYDFADAMIEARNNTSEQQD